MATDTTTAPADEEPKEENKDPEAPAETSLVPTNGQDNRMGLRLDLNRLTMNQLNYLAKAMAASQMFPDIKGAATAIVKILAGQEIGVTPFQAMTNINIIQGKATMGANLMAAKLKGSGKYDYRVPTLSSTECTIDIYQNMGKGKSEKIGSYTMTMADATRMGLAAKDNWRKYPQAMLFARAVSQAVRLYAPDIFNGNLVYTPEEMGADEDGEGNMVVGSDSTDNNPPKQSSTSEPTTTEPPADNPKANPVEEEKQPEAEDPGEESPEVDLPSAAQVKEVEAKFKKLDITTAKAKQAYCELYIGKKKPVSAYDYNDLSAALNSDIEEREASNA